MLAMGERMDSLQLVPDIASGQISQQLQVGGLLCCSVQLAAALWAAGALCSSKRML